MHKWSFDNLQYRHYTIVIFQCSSCASWSYIWLVNAFYYSLFVLYAYMLWYILIKIYIYVTGRSITREISCFFIHVCEKCFRNFIFIFCKHIVFRGLLKFPRLDGWFRHFFRIWFPSSGGETWSRILNDPSGGSIWHMRSRPWDSQMQYR